MKGSMAVGPGRVDRSDFFHIMSGLLKQDPRAKNVTVIEEALGLLFFKLTNRFVPIISFQYRDLDFDLSYAPIQRYAIKLPEV